jgi:IS5 family transposase
MPRLCLKADGHLGRCFLKGREGDAANVILTAVGHNLRLVLAWLSALLRLILIAISRASVVTPALKSAS